MVLTIPDVLSPELVAQCRARLEAAPWIDGNVTSGYQSAHAKRNEQIAENHPVVAEVGQIIVQALHRNPRFVAGALPRQIFPPLFNRYSGGQAFGTHIDNAVRFHRPSGARIRTDLSATLFFNAPDSYDGGELVIEDTYGVHRVKLPPGHLVVYPAGSLHHVTPVNRGARLASFFWIESMIRDGGARRLLFDLDTAIQQLTADKSDHRSLVALTGIYHNLLRRWADV